MNRRLVVTMLSLTIAVLALYARRLGEVPPYLHHDETFFAIQAQSIAATARDTHGRLLPVYFQVSSGGTWFHPVLVYFTALFLKVLPLSEAALRFPTVVIAVFDVLLVYAIGRRIYQSEWWAVAAAVLMVLTPAHLIHGRLVMDYLYPVPFMLAWLLCLSLFLERAQPWLLFGATTCLGFGFFSYIAATAQMPVYVATTCLLLWLRSERTWTLMAVAIAGFAWPVLLSVPFHFSHPEVLMGEWHTYGASGAALQLDPLQRMSELFNYTNVTGRVTLYFNFFNPAYLFMSGGANILNSTRRAGVFLMPLAIFIPVGIHQVLRQRRTALNLVIVAGFFTAPLAALTVYESGAIDRELELLPFGVLLATFGIEHLWSAALTARLRRLCGPFVVAGLSTGIGYGAWTLLKHGHLSGWTVPLVLVSLLIYAIAAAAETTKRWLPITGCLLLLALLDFQTFYRDYFDDYRMRASGHFEGNRRSALEEIFARVKRQQPVKVFVSQSVQYGDASWRFYTTMLGRDDLETAMTYFAPERLPATDVPRGALVLTTATAAADAEFVGHGDLTLVKRVVDLDGTASYLVFEKN